MEDLKVIWGKLNDLHVEIGEVLNKGVVENTYATLKKEEERHQKYTPLMIPYILILMTILIVITKSYQSWVSMIGILLITIGGFVMTYLFTLYRIPVEKYEHDRDTTSFLKLVKEKLEKRKHIGAIATTVYIFSLTTGLHLLIFGLDSLDGKWGWVGLHYGVMFALMGATAGTMYATYQKKYGEILKNINRFLAE